MQKPQIMAIFLFAAIAGGTPHVNAAKATSHQFVIYDPNSGRQLEPLQYLPMQVGNKREPSTPAGDLVELPQMWNPCSCADFMCMCCLGLRLSDAFNHRVCVALEYDPAEIALRMRINHNDRPIVSYGFSALNWPPFCQPVLLPLPLFACLRLYDIRVQDGNVRVCMSLMLDVFMNQLFDFRFDCVRFGVNGVALTPPTHRVYKHRGEDELKHTVGHEVGGISVGKGDEGDFIRKGRDAIWGLLMG